jgi:hypothetical protein
MGCVEIGVELWKREGVILCVLCAVCCVLCAFGMTLLT